MILLRRLNGGPGKSGWQPLTHIQKRRIDHDHLTLCMRMMAPKQDYGALVVEEGDIAKVTCTLCRKRARKEWLDEPTNIRPEA